MPLASSAYRWVSIGESVIQGHILKEWFDVHCEEGFNNLIVEI